MDELELVCFQLITSAGTAKSYYIEAIQCAKKGEYQEAEKLIADGDKILIEGHASHADMVSKEAGGESVQMSLILAHAEDQMMSTEVFKVMAEEMIELYKKVNK